jgi:hypothetical protein
MRYSTEVPPRHPDPDDKPLVRVERPPQPTASSDPQRTVRAAAWEYHHVAQQIGVPPLADAELTALGADGWELVNVVHDNRGALNYYFKRPKRSFRS